jgi:hypothetical protein
MRRITLTRWFLTLGMFVIAMLLSLKFPLWRFGSVCCVLLVYLWPEALGFSDEDTGHLETEIMRVQLVMRSVGRAFRQASVQIRRR